MAFGPIMRMKVGELNIELAPINREDINVFVSPGMQQASICRYLSAQLAPVLEDEYEWFEDTRKRKDSMVWGIWHLEGDRRTLIGNSSVTNIKEWPLKQGTTGVMIVDKEYWGKGIATSIHKARTWFLFQHKGFVRLKSAVYEGNEASYRALQNIGYTHMYTEKNDMFIDGKITHCRYLECLNPADWAWSQWWGEDKPTEQAVEAREKTREAMAWAEANVELP